MLPSIVLLCYVSEFNAAAVRLQQRKTTHRPYFDLSAELYLPSSQ